MEQLFPIIQNGGAMKKESLPRKPFIEANSLEVQLHHLEHDCIIPVFAKDNERTISHQEFIDIAMLATSDALGGIYLEHPEIRVSHEIKGRTPEAIHKPAKELFDHEKTIYYERMAFIARIPSIEEEINGNSLALTIGGVRSYNLENLFNKKSMEKFKFFIGFQNLVCCNLCISTDGIQTELRASSVKELYGKIFELVKQFQVDQLLGQLYDLTQHSLTEHQFAQLIGRCRLYQHLPKEQRKAIPVLEFNDGQFNTIVKDYYKDESFCRNDSGEINLWNLYNLFTQANKSSYIDTFLDRNLNALQLSTGVVKALKNENSGYEWFLS
ncbi:MAG: DUF3871 family protein [Algoriphagus sp.]|uniref:DUF3871 family protein n=1 Tax=Algoriphagus sp. TaxID=1872435 RepID=UPI0017CCC0F7|nr:DUF3871 family protein [Algoriphagus sp.]NVJ85784.1 DUF3871 family protein [Algoriphagus sp.]